ncbi:MULTISPECIES: glycosyltransferase family 39 protein [unclassified Nocardia]|uniref:ArnT family glycosyltransferase n=1 Tax=unclassified Nocardia TaxID=2637762 RepID=UPI0024A9ED76|nr:MULTISPECIES: glycosyltransferase family 39 protein [unclassified Nocardia]
MTEVLARPPGVAADRLPPLARREIAAVAAISAAVLAFSTSRYGYFGDELYFLAAGRRLAFSYADQGPVLPVLARLMDTGAPDSYWALRLPALVLTVLAVVLCALLAREFGGGRAAQLLAAAGYASSPFLLLQGSMLTTNAVDTVLWVLITWLLVRWVRMRDDRLLLAAALVTAVDMQVKWLIPIFWLAVAVSSVVFGPRELVRRPALWLGGALVAVSMIPALLWQSRHGWPQLAMGRVIGEEQDVFGGGLLFVPLSIMLAGWLGVLLLGYGTWLLLARKELRPYRFLGVTLILLYAVFLVVGGRVYYTTGMYAAVMAVGAFGWIAALRHGATVARRSGIAVTTALLTLSVLVTLWATPWRAPRDIEPPADTAAAAVDIGTYGSFGWPELTAAVTAAYHELPPEQRAHAAVVTESYWQASALDQLGNRAELPPIHSPSRGWGYFGQPSPDTTVVLLVGGDDPEMRDHFDRAEAVGTVDVRLGFPGGTRDVVIWKYTGPKQPWSRLWPEWTHL